VLTPSKKPDGVLDPEKQYAVVLLNEDQLQQLVGGRPRPVNRGYSVPDVHSRFLRLKRQIAAAAIVTGIVIVGGALYFLMPQQAMASIFTWSETADAPTLPTGASFSVTVASLDSGDDAGAAATRVRSLGLPAFTRTSPDKNQLHQAMVGPFVSLDEAERAQRRLVRAGMSGARIFVDESLRNAPRHEPQTSPIPDGNPSVVLLGAPDRVSLVFEMPSEPRQVRSRRSDGLMDLDVGPMPNPVYAQQWVAPAGVHLVERLAIESAPPSENGQFLRAHIAVPEFAKANVRSEGRRVYVDLTWPAAQSDEPASPAPMRVVTTPSEQPIPDVAPATVAPPAAPRPVQAASAPAPSAQARGQSQYATAIQPIVDRLTEIKPFLISASQSDSPDIQKAVDDSLAPLEASLKALRPPEGAVDQHHMLTTVIRTARRAVDPAFAGDRQAQAQQAVAMFEASTVAVTPRN
jgi:hypothetical protein